MHLKPADLTAEAALPPLKEPVQILIAKSDRIYAEALSAICHKVFEEAQITIHTTGAEALAALQTNTFDYSIMGLRFPDADGIDLAQEASQKRLVENIIIVAEQQDRPILPSLRTSRIDAIVDTYSETQITMRAALRLVSKGQVYVSPTLRDYLVERHSSLTLRQSLTPGELRVLRFIGTGYDNEEACEKLGISEGTVQTHRRSIMRKFKVSSSTKLVFEAIRLGFVQTNQMVAAGKPIPDEV